MERAENAENCSRHLEGKSQSFMIFFSFEKIYFCQSPPSKTRDAILAAVRCGYRFIDCANDYGKMTTFLLIV